MLMFDGKNMRKRKEKSRLRELGSKGRREELNGKYHEHAVKY